MMPRARRSIAAIAIFAILANALVPGISRALARSVPGEVCTAAGVVQRAADPAPAGDHDARPHCPYCVPHAGSFGAPPPSQWAIRAPEAAPTLARFEAHAPAPQAAWRAPQPRAPPSLV